MKILIVDDNRQIRHIIRKMVQPLTTHIIECGDGAEALRMYEQEQPDCVLMDIEMGPIDGIEAATRIKAAHPEARLVFVTQHNEKLFRKAAANCGADGYVLKENLTELNTLISKLFPAQKTL